jgi:hypothetical protein
VTLGRVRRSGPRQGRGQAPAAGRPGAPTDREAAGAASPVEPVRLGGAGTGDVSGLAVHDRGPGDGARAPIAGRCVPIGRGRGPSVEAAVGSEPSSLCFAMTGGPPAAISKTRATPTTRSDHVNHEHGGRQGS